jgi:two-component system NtrC family sensor kinase
VRAELQRERDARLARENRAATMLTLAAGVAHEVSTPLSVIVGRAEQLEARAAKEDVRGRRALKVILEQSDRIHGVVRGFLRLARGDAPVLDRVDPAAVVRAAVGLVEHRFVEAMVTLATDVPQELPTLRGDARLLEQALVNLLLNARDACGRGGRVRVQVAHEESHVTLAVLDDGTGIDPDIAARILEPFFSTKPHEQGTGLGLAIANEIVAIHRGTLTLEPRSPLGTRATIRVPIEQETVDASA